MTNEPIDIRRKRLTFRSWHRGTREMDLLLGSFADAHLPAFSNADLDLYEQILEYSDPDLYNWMTEREPVPANLHNSVLEKLIHHKFAG